MKIDGKRKEFCMEKNIIEEKINEYFSKQDSITAVYIFGSFLEDRFKQQSDIDIALIFNENIEKYKKFKFRLQFIKGLEKLLQREVDIIDFEEVSLKMQHQILSGRLILCKNNVRRVMLEKKSMLNYIDMRHFYDLYENNLGKRF
ncbi:MAG: type VII toxin-antitoxin system MntA family adenylyltransferase antitoxin [Halanaerobium sp.]